MIKHWHIITCALLIAGCATTRELDPSGVYGGDKLLYQFDGVLLEYSQITQTILDLAERHTVTVHENEHLANFIADLERNRPIVLRDAKMARDMYLATKSSGSYLKASERVMKIAIQAAKAYLIEISTQPQAAIYNYETRRAA